MNEKIDIKLLFPLKCLFPKDCFEKDKWYKYSFYFQITDDDIIYDDLKVVKEERI